MVEKLCYLCKPSETKRGAGDSVLARIRNGWSMQIVWKWRNWSVQFWKMAHFLT